MAINEQNKDILEILLKGVTKNTANIDAMDQNGRTALHLAADLGNLDLMESLLDFDAQVDPEDGLGKVNEMRRTSTTPKNSNFWSRRA